MGHVDDRGHPVAVGALRALGMAGRARRVVQPHSASGSRAGIRPAGASATVSRARARGRRRCRRRRRCRSAAPRSAPRRPGRRPARGPRVGGDALPVAGVQAVVERRAHEAGGADGQVGLEVGRGVALQVQDPVAGAQALREKAVRDPRDAVTQLGEGPVGVGPLDRDSVPEPLSGARDECADVHVSGLLVHGRGDVGGVQHAHPVAGRERRRGLRSSSKPCGQAWVSLETQHRLHQCLTGRQGPRLARLRGGRRAGSPRPWP